MRVIPFNVKFRDTDQQILHLIDELKGEMPGILNWALKGRAKLYEQSTREQKKKTFPHCPEGETILSKLRESCDHEATFLREKTEANPNEYLGVLTLYDRYDYWAKRRNYRPVRYDIIRDAVLRAYPDVECKRITVAPGEKPTVFLGITWIP